jgi:hypothetical protein
VGGSDAMTDAGTVHAGPERFDGAAAAEPARRRHHHLPSIGQPFRETCLCLAHHRHVEDVAAALVVGVEAVLDEPDLVRAVNHVLGEEEPRGKIAIGTRRPHHDREGRPVDAHLHRLFDGYAIAPRPGVGADSLTVVDAVAGVFHHPAIMPCQEGQ